MFNVNTLNTLYQLMGQKKHLFSVYFFQILKLDKCLNSGNHTELRLRAERFIHKNKSVASYLLAKSYFLTGDYEKAENWCKDVNVNIYTPSTFAFLSLYIDILKERGQKEQVNAILFNLYQKYKSPKILNKFSNFIETKNQFNALKKICITENYSNTLYLSKAAFLAGADQEAVELWRRAYKLNLQKKSKFSNYLFASYTEKSAIIALKCVKTILEKENIDFFLISGTLLGTIRGGRFLKHDKDIDIGVWGNQTCLELSAIFKKSGYFTIQTSLCANLITIKHINGMNVDIFIHQRQETFWHEGVKSRWHNSPFTLKKHNFMGDDYNIPADFNLYLTENYGDWRIPKKDFDALLNTPNIEIIDKNQAIVYAYKKLLASKQEKEKWINLLQKLEENLK